MAKAAQKEVKKGAPRTYDGRARRHIAQLIKRFKSLSAARKRLAANPDPKAWEQGDLTDQEFAAFLAEQKTLASQRDVNLFPDPVNISLPTLAKIRDEFQDEMNIETIGPGRPTYDDVAAEAKLGSRYTYGGKKAS